MPWISTQFGEAIRFRYLAGDRGRRLGRFRAEHAFADCFVSAPDEGGYVMLHGGRRTQVPPGAVSILQPGERAWLVDRGGPRMVRDWATVRYTVLGTVDLFSLLTPPALLVGAEAEAVSACLAELNAAARACDRLDLAAIAQRDELGFRLLRLIAERSTPRPSSIERIRALVRMQPVLEAMERRLGGDLDRRALAREAGLSETRLHAVFSFATGESPYAYLTRLRLRRAQDLLGGGDLAVAAVAAAVGFNDAFHFSRTFKRAFGVAPRAFRRSSRAGW